MLVRKKGEFWRWIWYHPRRAGPARVESNVLCGKQIVDGEMLSIEAANASSVGQLSIDDENTFGSYL